MAVFKLTKRELLEAVLIGAGLFVISHLVFPDSSTRLLVVAGLGPLMAVVLLLKLFYISYTATYSTEKPLEEVKKDIFDERMVTREVMRERGFEVKKTEEGSIAAETYPTLLHKVLGKKIEEKHQSKQPSNNRLKEEISVNSDLRAIGETSIEEDDDKVTVNDEVTIKGRDRLATFLGLYMQKRMMEDILEEHDYSLEEMNAEVALSREKEKQ